MHKNYIGTIAGLKITSCLLLSRFRYAYHYVRHHATYITYTSINRINTPSRDLPANYIYEQTLL